MTLTPVWPFSVLPPLTLSTPPPSAALSAPVAEALLPETSSACVALSALTLSRAASPPPPAAERFNSPLRVPVTNPVSGGMSSSLSENGARAAEAPATA